MDHKTKTSSNLTQNINEKVIRIEERLERVWDCLVQMSDKITEMKYIIKKNYTDKSK